MKKVMHKEGKKEKETFPPTPPYKEKEKREEKTGSVSGSRVRVRVGMDTFFDPALDPVSVAVAVFGGDHDDRRLWRWYLYRIGEDNFRQLTFTQWRENQSDGMPDKPPACFQSKLTAALNELRGNDASSAQTVRSETGSRTQLSTLNFQLSTTPKGGLI